MRLGISQLGLSQWRQVGGSAPAALILDSLSPQRAYSLRKLRTAYAGSAIRVRRDSDNTEQDIGFSGNSLDTAALLSFAGAGSAFIRTFYDQMGNVDWVQTTQANQPRIVNAGTLETEGGLPVINFADNTTQHLTQAPFLYAAGAMTVLAVVKGSAGVPRDWFGELGTTAQYLLRAGSGLNQSMFFRVVNDANTTVVLTNMDSTVWDGTTKSLVIKDTGSAGNLFENGNIGTTATYTRSGTLTLTSLRLGAVNQNSQAIRVSEIILFSSAISNADQNTITADQGEEYGISVSPFLTSLEQLAAINGTGDNGPSYAVGLNGIVDWGEPVFIDRAKQARGWRMGSSFAAVPAENLDSEGALASLPSGETSVKFVFSSFGNTDGKVGPTPPDRSGRFRMTFTGSATGLTFQGCTNVTAIDANTYEFDCNWTADKRVDMTPTSFPIKASIIRTDLLTAHSNGDIFDPDWLANMPSGGCLRFMDWMSTNERFDLPAAVTALSEYPTESWQTWRRVPLSVMVNLCNAKSMDPWINIGHKWPDAMVTAWAEYLRDNLNSARRIRVELSNEIWNLGTFDQGDYFAAQAQSVWGVPDGYSNNIYLHYAGKRFAEVMQIFNTVFAGQTHRVIGVIAGQAASAAVATAILDAPSWQTYEPGSYVAPYTLAKELSIAPYIGWGGVAIGDTAGGNNIKTQLDISHAAAVTYLKSLFAEALATSKSRVDNHVPIAVDHGLRLTFYEYNNHFDLAACSASTLYSGGNPVAGALDVFIEATYSQEMADAQDELRDYVKSQNGSLMVFFVDMIRASESGTWGAKTHLEHSSLIDTALTAWHTANGRWWAQ